VAAHVADVNTLEPPQDRVVGAKTLTWTIRIQMLKENS
jgi:hypothetical protein